MATYYISTTGSNANSGSISSPWRTLYYACNNAITFGDIIHVGTGTFIESTQCVLAPGVSIEGNGRTLSIIETSVAGTSYTISMVSNAGTSNVINGSQHITGIKMIGNYVAYGAIRNYNRSYVEVYNCDFQNFAYYGVQFYTYHLNDTTAPVNYSMNNGFYSNIMNNCGSYKPGDSKSAFHMEGQDGLLIYHNNIVIDYPDHENGNCIGAVEGFNKNVKIHDNTLDKAFVAGVTNWDFAIEMWSCKGGVEIYDNIIYGCIDIGGRINEKGASTYSVWIHNNRIGLKYLSTNESTRGIIIEGTCKDVLIERNRVENSANGIYCSQAQTALTVENIIIRYNTFSNIGLASGGASTKGWGIRWTLDELYHNHIVNNIQVYNNVFSGVTSGPSTAHGIMLPGIGTATNIYIMNNILQNWDYAPIYCATDNVVETIDNVHIENNIFYNNGNGNSPIWNYTPTNRTIQNNQIGTPGFVSSIDFHLQSTSIAIGMGMYVASGLIDIDGRAVGDPPDVGAYQYSTGVIPSSDLNLPSFLYHKAGVI